MNVTFKENEIVNGWRVSHQMDARYRFINIETGDVLVFDTYAGEGVNYSKVIGYYKASTERSYSAMRYLIKWASLVQGFSNELYQRYLVENQVFKFTDDNGGVWTTNRRGVLKVYEEIVGEPMTRPDSFSNFNLTEILSGLGKKVELLEGVVEHYGK